MSEVHLVHGPNVHLVFEHVGYFYQDHHLLCCVSLSYYKLLDHTVSLIFSGLSLALDSLINGILCMSSQLYHIVNEKIKHLFELSKGAIVAYHSATRW